ncbi:MAG: HD domain-containing protein [Candidatus Riflebacteria bacterium]|nr:HD domain-containing protein [Candidatus Riflebacteria bacterium]
MYNDLRLAEIAALFHDIGRFEQFARHRTFSDKRSFNHAAFGVGVLIKNDVLSRLGIFEQELIIKSISSHNMLELPDEDDESVRLHQRLLRDADKLDIWWVVTDYYRERAAGKINPGLELNQPDTPGISPAVFERIMNGETVLFADLQNLNDFKLLQVGWVFDVNFAPTLRRLKERGYLDSIRSHLPDDENVNELFDCVNNYIEQRLNTA